MAIQIKAAARLVQVAKASKRATEQYIESLGIKHDWYGVESLLQNKIRLKVDVDFFDKCVKALTKSLGKPALREVDPDTVDAFYSWRVEGKGYLHLQQDEVRRGGKVSTEAVLLITNSAKMAS